MEYSNISFLSDYGYKDEFVGVVKSVIWSITPSVRIVDITHGIGRHDVRAGGLALARASQYLCSGVVLAVVDPGVGSTRRGVAVELAEDQSVLVGPDNGLLAPAVAMLGGASRAVSLTNTKLQLPAAGDTFDGRDVFGPAAAYLCQGVPLEELGEEVAVASLLPAVVPTAQKLDDHMTAEALWVDHFGNVQLNVAPDDLDDMGERFYLKILGTATGGAGGIGATGGASGVGGGQQLFATSAKQTQTSQAPIGLGLVGRESSAAAARDEPDSPDEQQPKLPQERTLVSVRASAYDQLGEKEVGLVVDSYGMVSVAMKCQSASDELSLYEGMSVVLTPLSGDLVEFTPRPKIRLEHG